MKTHALGSGFVIREKGMLKEPGFEKNTRHDVLTHKYPFDILVLGKSKFLDSLTSHSIGIWYVGGRGQSTPHGLILEVGDALLGGFYFYKRL